MTATSNLEQGVDLEKSQSPLKSQTTTDVEVLEGETYNGRFSAVRRMLGKAGVEVRGIEPVPVEERKNTNFLSIMFLWTSICCNLLPIVTGMAGTLSYGLSVRDASLVIIFFTLLCCIMTAWIGTLGPKTGMRQIVQCRYSFGRYWASIIAILNLIAVVGFTLICVVIAGQTLSAVSDGKMTVTVGIVLSSLIGLFVSFCGYKILHMLTMYSWGVTAVCIVIVVGCGGKHLNNPVATEPGTADLIFDFGCLVAGFMLPFAGIMSDFAVYYVPNSPVKRMFWYTYLGQAVPSILLMILGAAIGAVVPNVESWNEGNTNYSAGGVIEAMLHPAGGFGKFVTVLLAFSLIGNVAASMYSITLNFQATITYAARVPRALYAVVTTAILIGVGIKVADSFFDSLENFLGVVSYWPGTFGVIIILEHFYFRKGDSSSYDHAIWEDASRLPPGYAAVGTLLLTFGLIVPCMNTIWFIGPIGAITGDIGFEVAVALSAILYIPLRTLEIKMCGRV